MTIKGLDGPTILSGQSLSEALDCTGGNIVRVNMPSDWDSSANLTFQVSVDGNEFSDVHDERGDEITVVVIKGTTVYTANPVLPVGFLKFRSGTSKKPVNQSADRKFSVVIEQSDAGNSGTTQSSYWMWCYVPGYGWMWIATLTPPTGAPPQRSRSAPPSHPPPLKY